MKRKMFSWLLIFALAISMIAPMPMTANAAEEGNPETSFNGYGWSVVVSSGFNGFVQVPYSSSNVPIGPDQGGSFYMMGADFVDDTLYAVSNEGGLYTIDTDTGAYTAIESDTGLSLSGFCYDNTSGTAYVSALTGSGSELYSIDLSTATTTLKGNIGGGSENIIGIASDSLGNIYGIDINSNSDNLMSINKTSGEGTIIGPLGIDINYAQDIAYDRENDILYGALYSDIGALYSIDISTGEATKIRDFDTEITAFAITSNSNVCKIIETGVGYVSLTEALSEVSSGETIQLLHNIEYSSDIDIDEKNITFDLNDFNLNLSGGHLKVINGSLNLEGDGEFNISNTDYAVKALTSGSAMVTNATSTGDGITAISADGENSVITVKGNVTASGAGGIGAYAMNGGNIHIKGNVISNGDGASQGIISYVNSSIKVDGNVTGQDCGVYANTSSSAVVLGNVSANTYGIIAKHSSDVQISGNVTATDSSGLGAHVNDATVTVGGTISAPNYISFNGVAKGISDNITPTTKPGYLTYTDSVNLGTVWVSSNAPGTLTFDSGGWGTYEGYDGWARVKRTNGSDGAVSVDYAYVDDTAITGINYNGGSGTLFWADGDSSDKVIRFTAYNDDDYIGNLYLDLILSNPTGGAVLGESAFLPISIRDNDNPPAPTGLSASAGNGEVSLEWNEVNDATFYTLYYSTSAGDFTDENSFDLWDGTSKTIEGLSNGTSYYFAVKAVHNIYYSDFSETVSATPSAPSSGGGSSSGGSSSPSIIVTAKESDDSTRVSTEIKARVSSGKASTSVSSRVVSALLKKAKGTNGTGPEDLMNLEIDASGDMEAMEVSFDGDDFGRIAEESNASLKLSSRLVKISFDGKALETIAKAGSDDDIVISASKVDPSMLSEKDNARIKGRPVYDFTVTNGDKVVSHFGGGHATIEIPYELQDGEKPHSIVVFYIADDGKLKTMRGHYDIESKTVIFRTWHFSKFAVSYNPIEFADVDDSSWYKDAVDFISAREITSGTGDNMYSPEAKLTRAQFLVLLMNAYQIDTQNESELTQIQNFTDAGKTYYTDYLLTAKSLGIVSGVGENMFAPEKEIARQEMFVMLYNTLKTIDEVPMPMIDKSLSDFGDASSIAEWANEAASALVKAGAISGSNDNIYPELATTRAEIAQLIYNLLSK